MRNKKLIILLSVVTVFVLAIVLCGATFLVRDVEAYNFYANADDLDEQVIAAAAVKKNSSIFFVDEYAVKQRVEKAYANVEVINVERKFPDKVSINYVVYDNCFQYLNDGSYYKCYSSGRIGSVSETPSGGYFIVKPKEKTNTDIGAYFQSADGYDRKMIKRFIDYLHTAALNDKQIAERIAFVDLTRDGYFYIRTAAGCSLEICGVGEDFERLIDDAWSAFVDPDPSLPISKATGTIRAYISRLNPDAPKVVCTYSATDGDNYYLQNYVRT